MIQKLRLKFLALALALMMPIALAVPATVQGVTDPQASTCEAVKTLEISSKPQTNDCNFEDVAGEKTVNDLIAQIINVLSAIVGIVAVIMIIIGGFRYITSGGAADKVTAAKNTILYGLIGLVIVALAQIIVKFVLTKVTGN